MFNQYLNNLAGAGSFAGQLLGPVVNPVVGPLVNNALSGQNIGGGNPYSVSGPEVLGEQLGGQTEANPIDGINPPVPPPAPKPTGTSSFIQSSTGPSQLFQSYQTKLDGLLNQADPFEPLYEQLKALGATAEKNAIASATTASARQKQQTEQSGRQYMAGLESSGISSGAARYLPEYQLGLLENARQSMVERISQVDQAEKIAIAKAQQARMEGDIKVLAQQMQQINDLRKEKIRSLERAQELEWDQYKFQQQMDFDKYKFGQQMSLNWAQENRMAAKAADTPKKENFFENAFFSINSAGGKITGEQFSTLMEQGLQSGLKRDEIIAAFVPYFNDIKKSKKLREQYGITEVEYAKIIKK